MSGFPSPQRTVGCYFRADEEESIDVLDTHQLARVAVRAPGDLEWSAIILVHHYVTFTQIELRVVLNGV